jgi:hypothetical protein
MFPYSILQCGGSLGIGIRWAAGLSQSEKWHFGPVLDTGAFVFFWKLAQLDAAQTLEFFTNYSCALRRNRHSSSC